MAWPTQLTDLHNPSIAPYNFVPLPEAVFPHPEGEEVIRKLHGRYHPNRHTGWIDLTVTTETPLYTRCAYDPSLAEREVNEEPHRQQSFHHGDPELPFLPGSTLRGMARTLVEIMGYGKIQWTKDRRLFFRSMEGGTLTAEYLDFFIEKDPQADDGSHGKHDGYKPNKWLYAGILHKAGRHYQITPCEMVRVEQSLIKISTGKYPLSGRGPMATPNWDLHQREVVVTLEPRADWHFHPEKFGRNGKRIHRDMYLWYQKVQILKLGNKAKPGEKVGILVISGGVGPRKHMEFVFIPGKNSINLDQEVVKTLEDKDQLTGWQENAFPVNKPTSNCREINGGLRDGEPIFYLTDSSGKPIKIGRAQMFRLVYDRSTREFVPHELRQAGMLDLAEAIFGIAEEGSRRVIKGRVSFEDARCITPSPFLGGAHDGRRVPVILSSPKPTSFQHYLVQQEEGRNLKHFNSRSPQDTVIRGHKLYWHKKETDDNSVQDDERARLKANGQGVEQMRNGQWVDSSQHTVIRPVKQGVQFKSRVHFENLSCLELGALLAALQLPDSMRHKLGMGKPLGLGSVKVETGLHLSDREQRYTNFTASGEVASDATACAEKSARDKFEKAIVTHDSANARTFWEIPRMQALAALLEWDRAPVKHETRYIGVDEDTNGQQWRNRKVLPPPNNLTGGTIPGGNSTSGDGNKPKKKKPSPEVKDSQKGGTKVDKVPKPLPPPPPSPENPSSKPKSREGSRVSVTIVANDGKKVTVKLDDGTQISFARAYYPKKSGDKVKLKITSLDSSGKITGLIP